MYEPIAAEIIRRAMARAAHAETPARPSRKQVRPPARPRRLLAGALRWSADRLAPEC